MTLVNVRTAVLDDIPAILAIYNDAVLHTTASYDTEPATLDARLAWFKAKVALGLPVFVAEEVGKVIGWSSYGPFRAAWPGYRYTVEHSIYVASDARGRGVGKLLLPPVIDHARRAGMHVLIAGVDAENAVSLRMHRSVGFEQVAHFRQVGWKFGRWLDLIFLELLLDEDGRPAD